MTTIYKVRPPAALNRPDQTAAPAARVLGHRHGPSSWRGEQFQTEHPRRSRAHSSHREVDSGHHSRSSSQPPLSAEYGRPVATLELQAGRPAKMVQERLGHKKVTTTLDIYARMLPDQDQDTADALGALLLHRTR